MLDLGINVLWFSKENYFPGDDLPGHKHDYFHYIYILGGTARITIEGNEYVAQEDEFFLTHEGLTHSLAFHESKGLQVIEIKFEVKNRTLASKLYQLDTRIKLPGPKIRHILESLINEGMKKETYYDDVITLKFLEVLFSLLRAEINAKVLETDDMEQVMKQDADEEGQSKLENVISYMEKNMSLQIDLDDLARVSRMSKYHFCRNFKKTYGISPIQYLNRMRIARAKELMLYSDMNITQLAYSVGFQDIHYFSRFFKMKEKMSPLEYMQKHKPNLYFYMKEYKHGDVKLL